MPRFLMIPYTQWQKQGLRYKCEQWRKNNEEKTIQAPGKYMLYQPILGTYKEEPLIPHDQAPYLEDNPKWACTQWAVPVTCSTM